VKTIRKAAPSAGFTVAVIGAVALVFALAPAAFATIWGSESQTHSNLTGDRNTVSEGVQWTRQVDGQGVAVHQVSFWCDTPSKLAQSGTAVKITRMEIYNGNGEWKWGLGGVPVNLTKTECGNIFVHNFADPGLKFNWEPGEACVWYTVMPSPYFTGGYDDMFCVGGIN
jgi:hypothetical protein